MLTEVAAVYSAVFAPELFVLLCGLLCIGYEWRRRSDRALAGLGARVGVLALGWAIGLVIYKGVPALVGTVPEWGPDATGSAGLGVGVLVIYLGWRLREWGDLVPGFAALLVAVTIPHLVITPFWDISTHVLYAVRRGICRPSTADSRRCRSSPPGWCGPGRWPVLTPGSSRSRDWHSVSHSSARTCGTTARRDGVAPAHRRGVVNCAKLFATVGHCHTVWHPRSS